MWPASPGASDRTAATSRGGAPAGTAIGSISSATMSDADVQHDVVAMSASRVVATWT